MDHAHDHAPALGLMATGWLVALLAGAVAGGLAAVIGGASLTAALIIAAVSFAVFGMLLGQGGVELNAATAGDHADHDPHGDNHGATTE